MGITNVVYVEFMRVGDANDVNVVQSIVVNELGAGDAAAKQYA